MTIPSILLRAAAVRRFLGSTRLLAAVAVILGALLAAQSVRWLCVGRRERAVLKSLAFKNDKAPERVKTRPVEEFDRTIMETGMLGPVQPMQLQGIMGSEALFGASPDDAQAMTVGAALPDGRKIVEIRFERGGAGERRPTQDRDRLPATATAAHARAGSRVAAECCRRPSAQERKESGAKDAVETRLFTG